MQRKNILIITSTFPVKPGDGIPRFILDLARALSLRANVVVLAPDAPGAEDSSGLGNGEVVVERYQYFWPRSQQKLAISNNRGMRDNLNSPDSVVTTKTFRLH